MTPLRVKEGTLICHCVVSFTILIANYTLSDIREVHDCLIGYIHLYEA